MWGEKIISEGYICHYALIKKFENIKYLKSLQIINSRIGIAQVLNSAWDGGVRVAGQNAQPCYDREGLVRLVETTRPRNHPDGCHFSFFVFHQPSPLIQRTICFSEIDYFIKNMHGEPS